MRSRRTDGYPVPGFDERWGDNAATYVCFKRRKRKEKKKKTEEGKKRRKEKVEEKKVEEGYV